jgi:peptidoglycan/xylan/chitin deacetylase (PgdA/CDA1 family)
MPNVTMIKRLVPVLLAAVASVVAAPPPASSAAVVGQAAVHSPDQAVERASAQASAPAAGKPTVVLSFDDSTADHVKVASMLKARGLKGTFYVNSGRLGEPGHLTVAGLRAIAKAGNEIGGHTLQHPHLPLETEDVQQTEICDDRQALLDLGFKVRSFAYPFGEHDESAKKIALHCGYTTARGVYGLRRPTSCQSCPVVEKLPPPDLGIVRTTSLTDMARTARNLEGFVTRAQGRDGLLIFVFHKINNDRKDEYATSPAELTKFLDWIVQRQKAKAIVVKTMGDAIGGPVRPMPDDL